MISNIYLTLGKLCSGGLPEKIPELTWEDLKQFHSVHYSPNNARFYSYGNLPLEKHLDEVNNYMPQLRIPDGTSK
jgi:Zn-dependent M16 (insulinase) family peptidase